MIRITPAFLFISSLSVLAVIASGCGEGEPSHGSETELEARSLVAFPGCQELVGYARSELSKKLEREYAREPQVGYPGMGCGTGGMIPGAGPGASPAAGMGGAPKGAPKAAESSKDSSGTVPDHSKTNVQEEGIDEPDIVKTDGHRLFSLSRGVLRVVDLRRDKPVQTDRVQLNPTHASLGAELLIHGNRVLVIEHYYSSKTQLGKSSSRSFRILEVDVSVPGAAKILGHLELEGVFSSARKAGATVRVVFSTRPKNLDIRNPWTFMYNSNPVPAQGAKPMQARSEPAATRGSRQRWRRAVAKAKMHNDAVLAAMTERNLLPRYRLVQGAKVVREGLVYGCEQSMRPGLASGVEMLSVLTLDLSAGLAPGQGTGVVARDGTTYAGASSLYIATEERDYGVQNGPASGAATQSALQSGQTPASKRSTSIHKFDLSDPTKAVYKASGRVNGALVNQFAMSEHKGVLRVAATRYLQHSGAPADSFVATFQERGKQLEQIGHVGNLGKTEEIKSVRFMGDVGYVVTFRQTDPLYTVDLQRPESPTVLGELKIDGFSAYLHPLSPGYLLGVGKDADKQGRIRGLQVSVFDVRDLRAPTRVHNYTLAGTQSSASFDHHAFLHWPKNQSVVLPVQGCDRSAQGQSRNFAKALVLKVDPIAGISLRGEIRHLRATVGDQSAQGHPNGSWRPATTPIERSVVVGDKLWTLSAEGAKSSRLSDLKDIDWIRYD